MKIILSSKYLAHKLAELDLVREHVEHVDIVKDSMIIHTHRTVSYLVIDNSSPQNAIILQDDRRWDHIQRLVNFVEDQPIILDINESHTDVIFQY